MECIKLVKTDCLQSRGISTFLLRLCWSNIYLCGGPRWWFAAVSPPKPKTNLGHVQHGLPPGIQMVACKADVWDPMESQTEIRDVVRHPDTKKTIDILLRDQWINWRKYKQKKSIDNAWVVTFRHRMPQICSAKLRDVYCPGGPRVFWKMTSADIPSYILTFEMHCGTCPGILNIPKRDISYK